MTTIDRLSRYAVRTMAVASLVALSALSGGTAVASARSRVSGQAGQEPWSSRIELPRPASVVHGQSVKVMVATGAGVRSFRAAVGSQVVSGAFRSGAGGTERTATLRRTDSGALRFGRDTLYVRTTGRSPSQRWYTQRSFVLARPVAGLIRAATAQPSCGTGSQLTVTLARPGLGLSVWVNGGGRRAVRGGATRSITLTADDGLRPGRNVIKVEALDPTAGGYTQRRLQVWMPAGTPVAGAGLTRRVKAGRLIRFDAGASVAATPGTRLAYRWTLVSSPRGSRARLRAASTAHPYLRPDVPGRYVVRVTVSEVPVHGSHATLARDELLCTQTAGASATIGVSAAVAAGPIGVPIDTITGDRRAPGVQIGDSTTTGAQFYAAPDPSDALQLLVLNRSTLALVQDVSYANSATDAANLTAAVKRLPSSDLVFITKPRSDVNNAANPDGNPANGDPTAAASINQALAAIGVSAVPATVSTTAGCDDDDTCSTFSAIGVPGIPAGQGSLNPGLPGVASMNVAAGDLHGYLREDLAGTDYTFVNVERVPFSTGDAAGDPAVVTIGSDEPGSEFPKTTYTSDHISGPGFFVLILSAGSLKPIYQGTYPDTAAGLHSLALVAGFYGTSPGANALVVVRSIGAVSRVGDPNGNWDTFANRLQTLGASKYYFDALDGKTSSVYAQVGPSGTAGYPSPWTEVASHEASGTGELSGLLARNPLGQFYPADPYPRGLKDPNRPLAGSLSGLMSLPTAAWPDRDTPGDQAVLGCIAAHIDPNGGLNTPIEDDYVNQNLKGDWSGWASTLRQSDAYTTFSADCRERQSFSEPDFDGVRDQLVKEWTAVPRAWQLISSLQSPLLDDQGNAAEIASIGAAVNEDVGTSSQQAHFDGMGLTIDLLLLADAIPGTDEIAIPLGALASGLVLTQDMDLNGDGSEALADVSAPAADLGATLARRYTTEINGFNQVGDILVSNWPMLQIAAQNAGNNTNAVANWAWTTAAAKQATDGLLLAARQQAFKTLFPLRYRLYRLQQGTGSLPAAVADYACQNVVQTYTTYGPSVPYTNTWKPFASVAAGGGLAAHVSGEGAVELWAYAGTDGWLGDGNRQAQLPPADLLAKMFTDSQDDAGLSAPLFDPLQFAVDAYPSATAPGQGVTHAKQTAQYDSKYSTSDYCQKN
ncbi:MAG TPA: hypothetical protein VHX62_01460 [Solirubrobacteraceae bacterium]|nr:hypothetical protein [Solirubrobacteraceae bacterium]